MIILTRHGEDPVVVMAGEQVRCYVCEWFVPYAQLRMGSLICEECDEPLGTIESEDDEEAEL